MGIEAGFDFDAGIDEAGLLLVAPGRRGVIRRSRQQGGLRHAADVGDRLLKGRADIADIAAECDQDVSHVAGIAGGASE